MFNKENIKLNIITIIVAFVLSFSFKMIVGAVIDSNIAKQKAAIEADMRAKGLIPAAEKPHKRDRYIPIDRTGQENRADSTQMFLKSAEGTFGQKAQKGLETVDYGSQVDNYQQEVSRIKKAESQKIAQRRAEKEAYSQKTGRAERPSSASSNAAGGTKINKLRTSGTKSFSKK